MRGHYKRTTAPTDIAVGLALVKSDLRLDGDEFDADLESNVKTATEEIESDCRRQLLEADFTLYLDSFPTGACAEQRAILLERCPVLEVSEIRYMDAAGNWQTMDASDYRVDIVSEPCRVAPEFGLFWPITRRVSNAVEVDFKAGYGTIEDVPEIAKQAIRARVRELFEGCGTDGSEAIKSRLKWGSEWQTA